MHRLFSRRLVLLGMIGWLIWPRGSSHSFDANNRLAPLIRSATGGHEPQPGRVVLTLPPLAESGHSIPLKVHMEALPTPHSYVKEMHLFAERNPKPTIATFKLGPDAGRTEIHTRIRLAGTQAVTALAILNDGSSWMTTAEVVVTAAACVEAPEAAY